MTGAQWLLEAVLMVLLGATLFHAMRLERALGVLKRDRAVLEELVAGFNDSTRQAEVGVERLRAATEGAGRQIARQIDQAQRLRDDLGFLTERSEKLAERLEAAVRGARMASDGLGMASAAALPGPGMASHYAPQARGAHDLAAMTEAADAMPRLRSEAERDLLRALRAAR
jgi:hypothetical protein